MSRPRRSAKTKAAVPPVRQPTEGARERLLQVATKLFAEKGLDGVSVRDLSKEAGVNVSLISYYFGGKEGLYTAILEEHALGMRRFFSDLIARSRERTVSRSSFAEEIRTVVSHMVEMRLKSADISVLMQRERLSGLPYSRKIYEEIMGPIAEDIVGLVARAQEAKVVREGLNPRAYFLSLIESIFGYFAFHDCRLKILKDGFRFPKDKDEYIDFMVRLYTEGVYE